MTFKKTPTILSLALIVAAFAALPTSAQEPNKNKLFESVRNGDVYTINTILENGANVNEQDRTMNTALMIAAKVGDRLVIETLLNHDADPNLRNGAGATALMIAAKYGNSHAVDQLLFAGADPLIKNNSGIKASRFAAAYKHEKVYRALIDAEESALKGVAVAEKRKTS